MSHCSRIMDIAWLNPLSKSRDVDKTTHKVTVSAKPAAVPYASFYLRILRRSQAKEYF